MSEHLFLGDTTYPHIGYPTLSDLLRDIANDDDMDSNDQLAHALTYQREEIESHFKKLDEFNGTTV